MPLNELKVGVQVFVRECLGLLISALFYGEVGSSRVIV